MGRHTIFASGLRPTTRPEIKRQSIFRFGMSTMSYSDIRQSYGRRSNDASGRMRRFVFDRLLRTSVNALLCAPGLALVFLNCQGPTVPGQSAMWILDAPPVPTVYLEVDPADLKELFQDTEVRGEEWEKTCRFTAVLGRDRIDCTCGIRIHGGVSRSYPKLSFRLYFRDGPLPAPYIFAGFPAYKGRSGSVSQIVLNANAVDFSKIRNYLSMYLMAQLGAVVPRLGFMEVVLNGRPWGLYTAIERVNEDLIEDVVGHDDFDFLKAVNHDANLRTVDFYTGDSGISAAEGFEVIRGDTTTLCNLVRWLESDSFSYQGVMERFDMSSIDAYFMGCMYLGASESPTKNYYFVYDRRKRTARFIPWDNDATFGRLWSGQRWLPDEVECFYCRNGLYYRLMRDSRWRADIVDMFTTAFGSFLQSAVVLEKVEQLQDKLEDAVFADLTLWKDTLLAAFTELQETNEAYTVDWSDDPSDPLRIWRDDLDLIRSFVEEREGLVLDALEDPVCPGGADSITVQPLERAAR
jgi:hypothetical protein